MLDAAWTIPSHRRSNTFFRVLLIYFVASNFQTLFSYSLSQSSVMKRLITGLFIFLIGVTAAHAASGSLMFAATEMPKPDPCLPFIGQTSSWLNENFSGGVKFEYYERKELEKAIRDGKVDIILSEPEKPQD